MQREYLIPPAFSDGRLYVKIGHITPLIEFLQACKEEGLNTNCARTIEWCKKHLEHGYHVYLAYRKDFLDMTEPCVIASVHVKPYEDQLDKINKRVIDVERLIFYTPQDCSDILDLL